MVGFLGALAGGAMKGWGAGQLESIKAKREEKLHLLDQQFTAQQNELTREVTRQDMASRERMAQAQLASQEKLTGATLGVQERLGELQSKTALTQTTMTTQAQKEIAEGGNLSAETIAELNRKSQEHMESLKTDAAKDMTQMQIDAQADLNIKMVPMADGSWKMLRGNKWEDLPNDPTTGKPLNPLATDQDTPEMKNYKFMISVGVPEAQAQQIFTSKSADPTLIKAGLAEAYVKSFGNKDEAADWAENTYNRMNTQPTAKTPAAGDPNATTPASPTSAAIPPKPTGVSDDVLIQQAKRKLALGIPEADVLATLKAWKIDPTLAGIKAQ